MMSLKMKRLYIAVVVVICCSFILLTGCTEKKAEVLNLSEALAPSSVPVQSLSDPADVEEEEGSQVVREHLYSEKLDTEMGISIYLPPAYSSDIKYPVLYLLYGYGGTQDAWFSSLGAHRAADRLISAGKIEPLIIVSPSYGNSFGVNSAEGEGRDPGGVSIGPYEDYLIKELIPYIDSQYSTLATKAGRYVGGASMGGYAALYLGFNHTDLFSKIGGHSASIWDYTETDQFVDQRDWLYATDELREIRDPFRLAENRDLNDLEIYLDCGMGDPLAQKDYLLYELLQSKGVNVQWVPNAGGHSMSYWSGQLENYLVFYNGKQ